jgi:hypothetical protein
MPSWNELVGEFQALADDGQRSTWLRDKPTETLKRISAHRGDSNVVFYASAFLQKPGAPAPTIQITSEDLNGFMSVIFGMDWSKPLTLLLHTPGGVTNAAYVIMKRPYAPAADRLLRDDPTATQKTLMVQVTPQVAPLTRPGPGPPTQGRRTPATRRGSSRSLVGRTGQPGRKPPMSR